MCFSPPYFWDVDALILQNGYYYQFWEVLRCEHNSCQQLWTHNGITSRRYSLGQ